MLGYSSETFTYSKITNVQLKADPVDGFWFDRWSQDVTGTANPVNVRVNCEMDVTAIFIAATYTSLSPAEAKAMIDAGGDDLVIIDVREDGEYCNGRGHIPGSLNFPWTSGVLTDRYTEIDPEKRILVICRSGNRSRYASNFLAGKGYRHIYEIGGMNDWEWGTLTCGNNPPQAAAGPDQTVGTDERVTLDGSASTGHTALIYLWEQTAGPEVTLSDPESAVTTFQTPADLTTSATLTFELTVTTTNGIQSTDAVIITLIKNELPPSASAGNDQTVNESMVATLDASASSDADGTLTTYAWRQTSGPAVTLTNPDTPQPTFMTPPVPAGSTAELAFKITVTDDSGLQASDTVIITVIDNGITGFDDTLYTMTTANEGTMGVSVSGGSLASLGTVEPSEIDMSLAPDDLRYGLIDATATLTDAVPGAVTFTFHFTEAAPENYTWYTYAADGTWTQVAVASTEGDAGIRFSADRRSVAFTLTDNGAYDLNDAEGIIQSPSGLAVDPDDSGPVDPGDGDDGDSGSGGRGGCFISTFTGQ